MRKGATLVFVEVKLRRSIGQGRPEYAVTARKLGHTIRAAESYRQANGHSGPWQVDVVAIDPDGLRHVMNVTA
jgi:Holliday junction resolvase-like predicted endonuclease